MVHHGASRNRSLTAALSALTRVAGFEIVILTASALRAYKPIWEALCEHVVGAIFLSRKPRPKLLECDPFCFCHLEAPRSLELLLFYTSTCPKNFPWSRLFGISCSRLIKPDTHIILFCISVIHGSRFDSSKYGELKKSEMLMFSPWQSSWIRRSFTES